MRQTYVYVIKVDQGPHFYAEVINDHGMPIYTIDDAIKLHELIERGYMGSREDVEGLRDLLIRECKMSSNDLLIHAVPLL